MKSSLANMCCSFELEPQTLSEGQLTQAREVAQNQEPTEASTTLFNQHQVMQEKEGDRWHKMENEFRSWSFMFRRQHDEDNKTCHCTSCV